MPSTEAATTAPLSTAVIGTQVGPERTVAVICARPRRSLPLLWGAVLARRRMSPRTSRTLSLTLLHPPSSGGAGEQDSAG